MTDMPSRYNPEVEEKLYGFWESNGYFHPEVSDDDRKPFCIVIPPPNITSSLHMGHALDNAIQDCLVRWKRMQGYNALWMPGVDHAGIATQNVVEKELIREGKSRIGLGREEFVSRVWQWKEKYGGQIIQQLKLLGSSCDWERLRFTMDEKYSVTVREEFVRLYDEGFIYRGNRIINWCPSCRTALSDIEVEHQELEGKLYYINYPVIDDGKITAATTRPETMLGDTAIAVHPDDGRYKKLIGKTVLLPLTRREIEIVGDERVDPSFGTGAVKITPAHDPDDFEIGNTHDLKRITVIGKDGKMTAEAGKYCGQDRYVCRENVLKDLKEEGLLLKVENHLHSVGHCYRCKTVIEPLLSLQWFVKMKELAGPAIKAVEEGRIRFIPSRWTGVYLNWMKNINDWCISRQIWWGHRIPVWYCGDCKHENAARSAPDKCKKCGSSDLKQDEDVLDTWFSSALWPFAGLGWPEHTGDLNYFYPTSVLVTGYDIICFWVARMIITGIKFMGDIPFRDVYIHGIVRDSNGIKMSKSLGNVIDPREIIKSHGTDALRMALITAVGGQDIYFGEEKLEGMRNFVNKLWNAGRFIMMNTGDISDKPDEELSVSQKNLSLDDRWILGELQELIEGVSSSLENYRFSESAQMLYDFVWHKFCDWYLELGKSRLMGDGKDTAGRVLLYVWERILKLLHPFMPFVTEELWLSISQTEDKKSIMVSRWPVVSKDFMDKDSIGLAERKYDVIRTGRRLRSEKGIPPGKKMKFIIKPVDEKDETVLNEGLEGIKILLAASEIRIGSNEEVPAASLSGICGSGISVYMAADELDINVEKQKLKKQIAKVEAGIKFCDDKLSNTEFLKKAPDEIVRKEKLKKKELEETRKKFLINRSRIF